MSILLISDQLIHQQLIESLLTRMGHSFVTASNQDLAEYWLENKRFDCALLDAHSQSPLAAEIARRVHGGQFRRQKRMSLILLSSSQDSKQLREFAQLKISDFLGSPLKMNLLGAKIEQVLALRSPSQLPQDEQGRWARALLQEIRGHLKQNQEQWILPKAQQLNQLLQSMVKSGGFSEALLVWGEGLRELPEAPSPVHLEKSLYEIERLMDEKRAA